MTNPTEDYNDFVRANLPSGMTYSNFRYWVKGKPFVSYKQASWYLSYTNKMLYISLNLDPDFVNRAGEPSLVLDFTKQVFASDPSGWAEPYAVGGERPTMLLEFTTGEYGV